MFEFLLTQALKATVLLGTAAGVAALLRAKSAAARHLVWAIGFASVLILPLASLYTPELPVVPAVGVAPVVDPGSVVITAAAEQRTARVPWGAILWGSGFTLCLVRLAVGLFRFRRHLRSAVPSADPSILYSGTIQMPTTFGWRRPVILLPAAARDWSPDRLRFVLAHEMAHIQRNDWLTRMIAHVVCCLHWFNPLSWFAAKQLRREQELAADDLVLAQGAKGSAYAEHLLDIARQSSGAPAYGVAMAQWSTLESRLRALIDTRLDRSTVSRRNAYAAAAAALLLLAPIAAITSHAQGETANFAGVVFDASGGAIPNAQVKMVRIDGQNREITTAGADGQFNFARIPAGKYNVEVRSPGFQLYVKQVTLTGGSAQRLEAVLSIGTISEQIDIVGSTAKPKPTVTGTPTRIPVGGNVQATKILKMIRPQYPKHLQDQGIEGTVLLSAVIGTEGQLLSLSVVNSTAHPELAQAATDAVNQWKYQPTLLNGKPVEVSTTVQVNFRLSQ